MMRVMGVRRGDRAPMGADRVTILRNDEGEFQVDGVVSAGKRTVVFDAPPEHFATESMAINAAIAWASSSGCLTLYVERSA